MKKYTIYKLIDPNDLKIRYIGKTSCNLKERLQNHIKEIKHSKRKTRKISWLKELYDSGKRPIIEEIEVIEDIYSKKTEEYYIKLYYNNGHELYNIQIIGNGYENKTHSNKFKVDLAKRMLGNQYGKGKIWTEEAKQKRKLTPPWNKGMKGVVKMSDETRLKMSKSHIGKRAKKINRFSQDGNFIDSFDSISDASKQLKFTRSAIQENLSGRNKTTNGFIFKYISN